MEDQDELIIRKSDTEEVGLEDFMDQNHELSNSPLLIMTNLCTIVHIKNRRASRFDTL